MPHFRFAYPVRLDDRGGNRVYVSCRDLPELNMVAVGNLVSILNAVEASLDRVVERRLLARDSLPEPSPRDPGEVMVAPSPAMIAKAAKQLSL